MIDCIALHAQLGTDPRTLRIAGKLRKDPDTIVGKLYRLGTYATLHGVADADETPDTENQRHVPLLTPALLDTLLGTSGIARELQQACMVTFDKRGALIDGTGWCVFGA